MFLNLPKADKEWQSLIYIPLLYVHETCRPELSSNLYTTGVNDGSGGKNVFSERDGATECGSEISQIGAGSWFCFGNIC